MTKDKDYKKVLDSLQKDFGWADTKDMSYMEKDLVNDVIRAVKKLTIPVVVPNGALCEVCNNDQVLETEDIPATDEALAWWRHISNDMKADLIVKEHPNCLNQSDLMRFALFQLYSKNPQKLFDKWIEENE